MISVGSSLIVKKKEAPYGEFEEDVLNFMSVLSIIETMQKIVDVNNLSAFVAKGEDSVSAVKVFVS